MDQKESLRFISNQLLLILLIVLLALIMFAIGLMVGYGVIGDGDNIWAILSAEKWQELIGKFTGK
ncbi:DNA-directed RNA polymerase subunit beta [Streptococcus acidominimus]|uniref:Competence associated protein n=1 Tax=Streptococcus acidominimus TaxID=1326 RepID=A0A1Q8EE97_STRAI|nr:DNA-directed RNA polymerase subunit beta [Streptococcus acidominimus]MBF0848132.1 DNA-directed RNA polymerase subunit beta [Streptococcus danieliae]MBF0819171.1 DNA-directed RNA polymerase subunit beta [Streptococcus acidominimus]MBF0837922.1 DNA-directed RNA polymerase subunit beta [Streptococcus acidominimus]OLF50109.1 DNA-directed RNA polymerase subunit beta [Streptococcus acidominimus]TFU30250.1 DNA-directed RNA polymerase subunit beta [Streptococcus acidominimus]